MPEEAGTVADAEVQAHRSRPARNPKDWLLKIHDLENVAPLLETEELDEIGLRVVREYEIDDQSRNEWKKTNEEAMRLAKQVLEEDDLGANVKYPLITVAAIQFASRALPEIIPGNNIVKAKVIGRDDDNAKSARGKRISEHMSYQLLEEMEEWEEETDKLLHALPILGTYFRKSYYDSRLGRNVSRAIPPEEVVVNVKAKSLETASRITHVFHTYLFEVHEFVQSGIWLDQPIRNTSSAPQENPDEQEDTLPHCILEQHRRLDLDHDGYPEPYIVTVHKDTSKVVRILARFDPDKTEFSEKTGKVIRIEPVHYFTKFSFLPHPEGGIYDLGFGSLLFPLNDTVNTLINQLLDSGTQANLQAGFLARGVRMKAGTVRLEQGEWKTVDTKDGDLRKSIMPVPVHEPSDVLFKLLGLLLEASKDISSVKDVMTGQEPTGANVPATTVLMLVEQGTKVFNAIYKRIYRALKQEFKKLYRLNGIFLKPIQYFRVMDDQRAIQRKDYDPKDLDIVPVSDPTMATDVQRMAKAQAVMGMTGRPNVNEDELTMRYLVAIGVEDPEKILPPAEKRPKQMPDPKILEMTGKLEIESKKLALEIERFRLEQVLTMAQIEKIRAQAIEHIAKAEAQELGPQLQLYLEALKQAGAEAKERITMIGNTLSQKAGQSEGKAAAGESTQETPA